MTARGIWMSSEPRVVRAPPRDLTAEVRACIELLAPATTGTIRGRTDHPALRRARLDATPSNNTASAAMIAAAGSGTAAATFVIDAVAAAVPLSLITRLPPFVR